MAAPRRRRSSPVRAVAAAGAPARRPWPPQELPGWLLLTHELLQRQRSSCVEKLTDEGAPSIMELLRCNTCMKDLRAQRAQESFQPPLKIPCDFLRRLKTSGWIFG
jgi:hypothetical protein